MDSFSPASGSVDGGEELLIAGANFSAQSRVFFTERGPGETRSCSGTPLQSVGSP